MTPGSMARLGRVAIDRGLIRAKAMVIVPNDDFTGHAVTLNPPTTENPGGFHRLIGGGVEFGERHRDAIVREVDEELGAKIQDLAFLACVENIFRIDGAPGHEIVFVYSGRLRPQPAARDATLTESDGSSVSVVWRPFDDASEPLPLYPAAVIPWVSALSRQ
jgi:ADP-ribose pyrophosphatase YjhB (NUDIX family)